VSTNCPHCKSELSAGLVAELKDQSQVSFVLHPAPGELMNLETVGGTAADFAKLVNAVGRDADLAELKRLRLFRRFLETAASEDDTNEPLAIHEWIEMADEAVKQALDAQRRAAEGEGGEG
jgi:hypothetical protein